MAEFPSFEDVTTRAKDTVKERTSSVLWWVPDPIPCDNCGLVCEESSTYDPQTAAFHAETNGEVPTWYCENCEIHYRRGDPYESSAKY
jgi:Pyruvate/2-oxoacid:ferredoxin oxidoreductase delta subunit